MALNLEYEIMDYKDREIKRLMRNGLEKYSEDWYPRDMLSLVILCFFYGGL